MNRDFKGVWIPKDVWLDKNLSLMEKVFYVEIDSLDNKDGCYASNGHFSEMFDLSKQRCSQIIKSLEKKDFIKTSLIYNKNQVDKRVIRVSRKFDRGIKEIKGGYQENAKGINTINNTDISKDISMDFDNFLKFINLKTGRNFKVINKSVRAKYKARLKEGYTKDDISNAISNAVNTQYHKDNNYKHLTPEFFSRADKIDAHSNTTETKPTSLADAVNQMNKTNKRAI